ncbi:MAG: hypothetical protein J6A03_06945 [Lachnospiraceae bacterium]|nr:hypothetical protein [Lachnospiraceae bacterium]
MNNKNRKHWVYILVIALILQIFPFEVAYADNDNDVFEIVAEEYGVENNNVVAQRLSKIGQNTEFIETYLSNIIMLKETVSGGYVNIYIFGPQGFLKKYSVSESSDWLNEINNCSKHSGKINSNGIFKNIFLDGNSSYKDADVSDCIYSVKNPNGKYDLININQNKYYEYGADDIYVMRNNYSNYYITSRDSITYVLNEKKGVLNAHGEKVTDAVYDEVRSLGNGYYELENIVEEDGNNKSYIGLISEDGKNNQDCVYHSNIRSLDSWIYQTSTDTNLDSYIINKNTGTSYSMDRDNNVFYGENSLLINEYYSSQGGSWFFTDDTKYDLCKVLNRDKAFSSFCSDKKSVRVRGTNNDSETYISESGFVVSSSDRCAIVNENGQVIYDYTNAVLKYGGNFGLNTCNYYEKIGYVVSYFDDSKISFNIFNSQGKVIANIESNSGSLPQNFYVLDNYGVFFFDDKTIYVNVDTGNVITYDSAEYQIVTIVVNEKNLSATYFIGDNHYTIGYSKGENNNKEYYLFNIETGKKYNLMYSKYNNDYLDDDEIEDILVGEDDGAIVLESGKLLNTDLECVMEGVNSTGSPYIISSNSGIYTISGEALIKGWSTDEFKLHDVARIKKYNDMADYRKKYSYALMDRKGEILTDNYYYLSEQYNHLSYFAELDEEDSWDEDLDKFGIINSKGALLIKGSYVDRFYYYDTGYRTEGITPVTVSGNGIILKYDKDDYILYNWNDNVCEIEKKEDTSIIDDYSNDYFDFEYDVNCFQHSAFGEKSKGNVNYYYTKDGTKYITKDEYLRSLSSSWREYLLLLIQSRRSWNGSCYGISMAMLLNKADNIDLTSFDATCFNDIKPNVNTDSQRYINYLYLTQLSSKYNVDKMAVRKLKADKADVYTKRNFLKLFVVTVKNNELDGIPTLLCYSHGKSGHAVIATNVKELTDNIQVTIYDMNSVGFTSDGEYHFGSPQYMYISKDYKTFSYDLKDGDNLSNNYNELCFLDNYKLLNADLGNNSFSNSKQLLDDKNGSCSVVVNDGDFELYNKSGEKIEYKDGKLEGDIDIKTESLIVSDSYDDNGDVKRYLELEQSDSYNINTSSGSLDMTLCDDNSFMSVDGDNIDKIEIKDSSYIINGNDSRFTLSIESENKNAPIYSVYCSSDDVTCISTNDGIEITSEQGMNDIIIDMIIDGENSKSESISISANKLCIDNEIINDTISISAINNSGQEEDKSIMVEDSYQESNDSDNPPANIGGQSSHQSEINNNGNNLDSGGGIVNQNYTSVEQQTTSTNNIKISKAKISSLKNKKSKSFTIKYKKVKNAKGYELQYALNKKFTKSKKTKTATKLTITVKKLKKGKTYYVRVRAYNVDSKGSKVYGKWSSTKKVKIKK